MYKDKLMHEHENQRIDKYKNQDVHPSTVTSAAALTPFPRHPHAAHLRAAHPPSHNAASSFHAALTQLTRHPYAAPSLQQCRLHTAPTLQQRLLPTAATQGLTSPPIRPTRSPHTAATPLHAALAPPPRRCTPPSRCPRATHQHARSAVANNFWGRGGPAWARWGRSGGQIGARWGRGG